MSRKVLLQLVLPLIGLSVLFWLLAFAPGDKHYQPALLEMSVILRDGDGNVSAMRKGMEQAAKDLNVELRFLTPALIELLVKNPRRVYSRENLMDLVWGYTYAGDYRTVDVHIRRLREKLEENPAAPQHILTKWGVGYYLKD